MPTIQRKSINLFEDKDIRCYKVVFNITNEEDLLQWWEYQLDNSMEKYQESITFLHALYRACFNIIDEKNISFDIIFEKSQEAVYWTIWSKELFPLLASTCKKCIAAECKAEGERVSFKLSTLECKIEKETPSLYIPQITTSLEVFDFLDPEDQDSLIDINSELADELIYLDNKGFSENSITKLQKLLSTYSFVLGQYRELHHIKTSIDELCYFMNENRTILIALDKSYISLFEGLILNLQRWYEALFVNGASSIEEYKDSIIADVAIIKTMTLQSSDDESGDLEFF